MANIGESRTARLARGRFEAIKKFLPVRDRVRQKLQARQEANVEFATGAEELLKPVTTATEKAATVTKEALLGETGILPTLKQTTAQTDKIAKRTKQTKKIIRDLPADIVAAQPQPPEATAAPKPEIIVKPEPAQVKVDLVDKFQKGAVKGLRKGIQKKNLGKIAAVTFDIRDKFLQPEYLNMDRNTWYKAVFRGNYGANQVRDDDGRWQRMKTYFDEYFAGTSEQQQQQSQDVLVDLGLIDPPKRTVQQTQVKQPKTERGFTNVNISTESGFIAYPNNIVDDVSRLEVLIGGKRARKQILGNNKRSN